MKNKSFLCQMVMATGTKRRFCQKELGQRVKISQNKSIIRNFDTNVVVGARRCGASSVMLNRRQRRTVVSRANNVAKSEA